MFVNYKMILQLLPGAAQGLVMTIVGHPLDTVKTRMQSNMFNKGMINCIVSTVKNEGFLGLYRGMMAPLISHVAKRSYQFPVFNYFKDKGTNPYLAGLIAGASSTFVGAPFQVIKVNSQTTTSKKYHSSLDFTKQNYKRNGLIGFFKGFRITMIKDSVFGSVFLGNYTFFVNLQFIKKMTSIGNFIAGGLAHSITWVIFIPIDHIKTEIQQINSSKTITSIIKETIMSGRCKTLWKGVGPAVLRIFPVSGIGMVVYELVYKYLN